MMFSTSLMSRTLNLAPGIAQMLIKLSVSWHFDIVGPGFGSRNRPNAYEITCFLNILDIPGPGPGGASLSLPLSPAAPRGG